MSINAPVAPSPFVPTHLSCVHVNFVDPAVYYAHLAGNRARAHDPSRDVDDSSSGGLSSAMGKMSLEPTVTTLKPLHPNLAGTMWWI
jgi:hypothetical protein